MKKYLKYIIIIALIIIAIIVITSLRKEKTNLNSELQLPLLAISEKL